VQLGIRQSRYFGRTNTCLTGGDGGGGGEREFGAGML